MTNRAASEEKDQDAIRRSYRWPADIAQDVDPNNQQR